MTFATRINTTRALYCGHVAHNLVIGQQPATDRQAKAGYEFFLPLLRIFLRAEEKSDNKNNQRGGKIAHHPSTADNQMDGSNTQDRIYDNSLFALLQHLLCEIVRI